MSRARVKIEKDFQHIKSEIASTCNSIGDLLDKWDELNDAVNGSVDSMTYEEFVGVEKSLTTLVDDSQVAIDDIESFMVGL